MCRSPPAGFPEAVAVLESAREETDRMTRIVRNLLTLARFEEGTLRLLKRPVDLHGLALEASESLGALARECGATIDVSGSEAVVNADAEYLRTAVVNLLENAITYSGRGSSVTLSTSVEGGRARLSVRDTGPGIPPQARPHLFDRFYRVDPSRSKRLGGSGLGLSIVKEIVDAHGGAVELETEMGRGSTFTVVLPVDA